jgi:uncharacterized protein YbjQ (UPF0145 family)
MGCVVEHIGWEGFGGCGYYGLGGYGGGPLSGGFGIVTAARTVTSGQAQTGYAGFAPFVDAVYSGYETAISRMLEECRAVGGDGVVGVSLTASDMTGHGDREFLAYGTALRAAGGVRPRRLFSTTLAGQDVAKLLHGGWAPAGIVVAVSVAVRHDDLVTRQQASMFSGNVEVSGYSDLVHHVRADVRREFARRSAAHGAEGSIVSSMTLNIDEREVAENHTDHVAIATIIGTAIVQFHEGRAAPSSALKVLPLGHGARSTGKRSSHGGAVTGP